MLLRFQVASCGQGVERKKNILVVKLIASKNRKSKSSDSSIWDELKFENLSCLGWIKEIGRECDK